MPFRDYPQFKEIALRIPTALDRAESRRKARQAKEARAEYDAALKDWSDFVKSEEPEIRL